jgi:hypothetical protein
MRMLFIHHSCGDALTRQVSDPARRLALRIHASAHRIVAIIALANKLARIAWRRSGTTAASIRGGSRWRHRRKPAC